jgi:hypothetical protein
LEKLENATVQEAPIAASKVETQIVEADVKPTKGKAPPKRAAVKAKP